MSDVYVDENPFIDYIRRRIKANKNCLIIIIGATGIGKTYAGLRICEVLDPDFNISRIAFTGKDFIELADSPDLKPGSCIMLDEAGVSMDNRQWWSQHNRMINWLLQTFRHQRLVSIITVPQLNFIDKKSLALFHVVLEVINIDGSKRCSVVKPKIIIPRPSSLTDKNFMMYFPTIKDSSGTIIKVSRLHVHLPTRELRKEYEKIKKSFTSKLKEDSVIALGGGKLDTNSIVQTLSRRDQQIYWCKEMGFANKEIAERMNLTPTNVSQYVVRLRKKNLLPPINQ